VGFCFGADENLCSNEGNDQIDTKLFAKIFQSNKFFLRLHESVVLTFLYLKSFLRLQRAFAQLISSNLLLSATHRLTR